MPKNPPISLLTSPAMACIFLVVGSLIFLLKRVKYMLMAMRATPSIRCQTWSSMRVSAKMAMEETMMKASRIVQIRCHVMWWRSLQTIAEEVVRASMPESAVASP